MFSFSLTHLFSCLFLSCSFCSCCSLSFFVPFYLFLWARQTTLADLPLEILCFILCMLSYQFLVYLCLVSVSLFHSNNIIYTYTHVYTYMHIYIYIYIYIYIHIIFWFHLVLAVFYVPFIIISIYSSLLPAAGEVLGACQGVSRARTLTLFRAALAQALKHLKYIIVYHI